MAARSAAMPVLALFVAVAFLSQGECATPTYVPGLSPTYYSKTCPDLVNIVRDAVNATMDFDPVNMPAILRLHFHDCFVRGCDGSVLLDSKPGMKAEKDAPDSSTLFGFEAMEFIKGIVEDSCPKTVSCADILALAARDAVRLTGGPDWVVPLGRKDGFVSWASDVASNMPSPNLTVTQLLNNFFIPRGLNEKDLVVLSGAHTLGFAHCPAFVDRIYGFNTPTGADPTLDPDLSEQLQAVCPQPPTFVDNNTVAPLDTNTFDEFDFAYFRNLKSNGGILSSDQVLASDSRTKNYVTSFANNQNVFFTAWTASMVKMSQIGVLTGSAGEVRLSCNVVNGS